MQGIEKRYSGESFLKGRPCIYSVIDREKERERQCVCSCTNA